MAEAGLARVHVEGRTDGLVLALDLDHHYVGRAGTPVEIVHGFPIPSDAVILAVELRLDGQAVAVRLRDRDAAEDAFEAVQATTGFAAIVERVGPGACIASLGRLAPGSTATLRVRLARFLDVTGGRTRIVVPGVAARPGGQPPTTLGPADPFRHDLRADYPVTARFVLTGAAAAAQISSPSHLLSVVPGDGAVTASLADPAALDRDIVVRLDGLPAAQAVLCRDREAWIGIAAATPTVGGARRSLDLDILIDATGSPGTRPAFLAALLERLRPGDGVSAWLTGRVSDAVVPPCFVGSDGAVPTVGLDRVVPGDLPVGEEWASDCLRAGTDIVLMSDGRSRVAEAVAALAIGAGRRLFALGIGAAPNEALLAPAVAATGGDYTAVAPGEDADEALDRLLGALSVAPPAAVERWSAIPAWTSAPPWRTGRRGIAIAGFPAEEPPRACIVDFDAGREVVTGVLGDPPADRALAKAMAAVAAARRLPRLAGTERAAWAARFDLPPGATAWLAQGPTAGPAGGEATLVVAPQMVAAGWRGVGVVEPLPPPPAEPRSRPPSRRPLLGVAIAILLVGMAAGAWFLARPDAPTVAMPERFERNPIEQAMSHANGDSPGRALSPIAVGGAVRHRAAVPPRLVGIGVALAMLGLALFAWRRRRRG